MIASRPRRQVRHWMHPGTYIQRGYCKNVKCVWRKVTRAESVENTSKLMSLHVTLGEWERERAWEIEKICFKKISSLSFLLCASSRWLAKFIKQALQEKTAQLAVVVFVCPKFATLNAVVPRGVCGTHLHAMHTQFIERHGMACCSLLLLLLFYVIAVYCNVNISFGAQQAFRIIK